MGRVGVNLLGMTAAQSGPTAPNATRATFLATWLPLGLAAMCTLVFTLDGSMNIIALPSIAAEFNTSPAGAVWVAVAVQFVILGLALPIGSLSASFGRRRLFAIGLAVFLIGLAGSYLSPSLPALVASRALQGLGCALFLSTRNAIGMEGFPLERRGMALGVIIAAVGVGAASGPLLGGQLIDAFGWRAIYLAVTPVALTTAALAAVFLRREQRQPLTDFDFLGAGLVFAGLASLVIALSRTADWGMTSPGVVGLAGGGSLLMALFAWRQLRAVTPVLDLGIFKNPAVVVTSLALVLQVMGQSAATLVLPFFMVHALGLSATASGVLFSMAPAMMFVGSNIGGRLSDRVGAGPVMVLGMVFQVAGGAVLLTLNETSAPYMIGVALALMGLGSGFLQTAAGAAQMNAVPPALIGMASALFIALIMLASSVGGTLGGILMSSGAGIETEGPAHVAANYRLVAWAGIVVLSIGLIDAVYFLVRSRGARRIKETADRLRASGPPHPFILSGVGRRPFERLRASGGAPPASVHPEQR